MQKLKLTELLQSFSLTEIKRLGDFIRSPFFNKNKKLIALFEYLEKKINSSEFDTVSKESAWQYICRENNEKFSDVKMRSCLSDFKKLCEKFIVTTQLEKNALLQKNILLESLSKRNAQKNFEVTSNEIKNIFNEEFMHSFDHFHNKIDYIRTLIQNEGDNVEQNLNEYFYKLSDAVDYYFLSSKLDLVNSYLSRKYHVLGNITTDFNFTKDLILFIEKNITEIKKNSPFVYCEYLIFKMMSAENNDGYFKDLRSFVFKNIQEYKRAELEQIYFSMINFGFNKIAIGENDYLNSIFAIYKTFEARNFYSNMESFQDVDFISIAIAGLRLNKTSWVESFVGKYSQKLITEFKNDTLNLVRALIAFKRRDFNESIDYLNKVNYQNSYYYLKSKETLMQIYFEQKEYVALESLIDSTKHYLKRRRDVLSIHFERYTMFLKYLRTLLKAAAGDKSRKFILKKELKKNNNVIGRDWLMQKAEEI